MTKALRKTVLTTIDGTPRKRVFLSIISDYDLKTGVCELVDNAIDFWLTSGGKHRLHVDVVLDVDRQIIRVQDNAGGVSEDDAELLIAPGASRDNTGEALIGIFGVGGKRAGVALGELVEIRTRRGQGKTIEIDITKDWIESPVWDLEIFEVPDIDPGTTVVEISKVRKRFDNDDVAAIRKHLGETYSWFIDQGCVFELNESAIPPITFNRWAYPPEYPPREAEFTIEPAARESLGVKLTAGLILDRDPEKENYGAYFYCNNRLIAKEVKARDVGYFSSVDAGVPHPDASLCRVLVQFLGPAELMPWNSSKSALNFDDPAFTQIRQRVIDFTGYYTGLSRRLKHNWDTAVFPYSSGKVEIVTPEAALSKKKKILPKLPRSRHPSRFQILKKQNKKRLEDKPWVLGLVEAMAFVDVLSRQKYETRNRAALILLDSNFEIALKEYIVHRTDIFPPHRYTGAHLATIFRRRTDVINEVQPYARFPQTLLNKVSHYYGIRNTLIHERASVLITDGQVQDYRRIIERVLNRLFGVVFPSDD